MFVKWGGARDRRLALLGLSDNEFVLALAHAMPVVLVGVLMKGRWLHTTGWVMVGIALFGLLAGTSTEARAAAFVFAFFAYGGTWGAISLIEDWREGQAAGKKAERERVVPRRRSNRATEQGIASSAVKPTHQSDKLTVERTDQTNRVDRKAISHTGEDDQQQSSSALGPSHKQALPHGSKLYDYRLDRVLGAGGFGITYLGQHPDLGSVAIKEYLPNELAVRHGKAVQPKSVADREDFDWGLDRFLNEAKTLARFRHRNIVRVRDCFKANDTAYIVMNYEDGLPLDALLRRRGTLTEAQLHRVLLPLVDGLRQVHAAGFLHRDIKPSNIFVRRSDESPVLLDFGSARQAFGRRSKSMTAIASAGYAPPEQYESNGPQGAWTDIYALSALCYRAIMGNVPMEALSRQRQLLRTRTDPLPKLADARASGYSSAFLEAVDWGLRVVETERPQDLEEWSRGWQSGEDVRKTNQGEAETQHRLGDLYYLGKGRPKDAGMAAMWYRKAAEQGHARAQASLGSLCRRGDGVPKNAGQAARWYRRAAEQGHARAQYNLGLLYDRGDGVPKNAGQAATWYRRAAAQGHAKAQQNLAAMYDRGDVPKDAG